MQQFILVFLILTISVLSSLGQNAPSTSQVKRPNLLQGEQARAKSDWDNAILYFNKAIDTDEAKGDAVLLEIAYSGLCQAYFSKNQFDLAVPDCDKAIQYNSRRFFVYLFHGFLAKRKGFIDQAINDFSKAIEINPASGGAYSFRGEAYSEKHDYDLAFADLNKAIELTPDDAGNYSARAHVYEARGDLEKAIIDYSKAIEVDPKDPFLYIARSTVYRKARNFDKAELDGSKAIELAPNFLHAYINRGNVYLNKGQYDRAIADYDKALQIDPKSTDALLFRGTAYSEKGNYDQAIVDHTKVIQIDPNYTLAYTDRGGAFIQKGEYRYAVSDFRKRVQLEPSAVGMYYSSAWANLYANDGNEAYADADRFLKAKGATADPGGPYAVLVGYLGLRKNDKADEAKNFLDGWIRQSNPGAWTTKIMHYFYGDVTEQQLLELAVDNDKLTEAHTYIAAMQLLNGKTSEARDHFNWVKANGNKEFSEYVLAIAELKRLDPTLIKK